VLAQSGFHDNPEAIQIGVLVLAAAPPWVQTSFVSVIDHADRAAIVFDENPIVDAIIVYRGKDFLVLGFGFGFRVEAFGEGFGEVFGVLVAFDGVLDHDPVIDFDGANGSKGGTGVLSHTRFPGVVPKLFDGEDQAC
jgi:hypothetical protein